MKKPFLLAFALLVALLSSCHPVSVSSAGGASTSRAILPPDVEAKIAAQFPAPLPGMVGALQTTAQRNARCTASVALVTKACLYNGNKNSGKSSLTGATVYEAGTWASGDTVVACWSVTWNACASGAATVASTPIAATASTTGSCSAANATSCWVAFIDSNWNIEWVSSASLTGGGGEVVIDVQPQSSGTVNLTSYTHTEAAGS